MPNRDGTGPEGKGPRSGRGLGPCNNTSTQTEQEDCGVRRGLKPCGGRFRRGRGFRGRN